MFSLIPSDANDPQGLMRRKEPNKQTNKQESWKNLKCGVFISKTTMVCPPVREINLPALAGGCVQPWYK